MSRTKGPQHIGSLINDDLLGRIEQLQEQSQCRRIEEAVRPGESCKEAAARSRTVQPTPSSRVREPPSSDAPPDSFVPALYDVGTKDSRSIMDVAVFRLSKKNRRAGEVIHYTLPDGHVTVSAGAAGMASVWDYDLVLMAVSHLTEAMNRYREGKGEKPGRVFRTHITNVFKFCRRAYGGKQKYDLVETCIRLNTTHLAIQRTRRTRNGRTVTGIRGRAPY
jgi:hypothetical protein